MAGFHPLRRGAFRDVRTALDAHSWVWPVALTQLFAHGWHNITPGGKESRHGR
ncbi:MAG: hypothetical protein LKE96_10595 [Acetobacter peroxydans]|jgi:hypothetical protein|nr:hypothetical protein [Acetobacter peroxydans]MCI2008430.1 hypothetical protein [Acetobacter peroxydans]MCI2077971.1 hypothetical protein [Acetobacter peroxydans]